MRHGIGEFFSHEVFVTFLILITGCLMTDPKRMQVTALKSNTDTQHHLNMLKEVCLFQTTIYVKFPRKNLWTITI